MNKISSKVILIGVIIVLIILIGVYFTMKYIKEKKANEITEYTPQEEISEEQLRETMVSLYYKNKETNKLMPEARMVDVSVLIKDPYVTLVKMLMEAPKNDKLIGAIPEGTQIIRAELKKDVIYLDLSKEFVENHVGGKDEENNTVYSIVNTLTELTEVNAVRILIDGQENQTFKDKEVNFKDNFFRRD